ncbi:unnamed protein product [Linum trigynum]|uniref:DUF3615 domain-containing protein n=1 Tax=Linum trigynum TaxID=586398 RepID=A0AAV2FN26_9ROSI
MPKAKLKTTIKDAVSEMQQLQSDLIRAMDQLELKLGATRPLQEAMSSVLDDEMIPCLGELKSIDEAALEVLPLVRDANHVPIGVVPSPEYLKELEERCLIFRTTEHQTEFFAKKIMKAYKDEYPAVVLELEEGVTSNTVESCGCLYVHINFKVKDVDGSVHLFFAEATFDYDPVVLSHCILERGDTGGYDHYQKGCGGCDPDAEVPIYHPRGDYLHGY